MIGYAIWDQTNLISNRFLREYIRDTFFEITMDFGSVSIDHDLEHLLEGAVNSSFTHLVVFQSGHTTRASMKLRRSIDEFCKQDFLIAGQIIHHVNTYPFLHPQMFIVNMTHYRALGRPMVGFHEDSDLLELHRPDRSPGNVHDDYTPIWLKPTGEIQATIRRDFGWNLIHESLQAGFTVLNLPESIRYSKRFLYPDDHPHQFADCLEKLSHDALAAIPTNLTYNQTRYLFELLNPGTTCATFLFNTEKVMFPLPPFEAKRILGVAAGFKLFVIWAQLHCTADVVYFDHNRESLRIWKDIVQNWSGVDFAAFCNERGYHDDFARMREVFDAVGGEDRFVALWKRYQATNPKFMRCDILTDHQALVSEMADHGNVVWYSNCFKYFESIRRYGSKGCEEREKAFLKALTDWDKATMTIGSSGFFWPAEYL